MSPEGFSAADPSGRATSASWASARPVLSVLIPFRDDDPRALLADLERQAGPEVEIVLIDDASDDPMLRPAVRRAVVDGRAAACLIHTAANLGRAEARNRLAASARGRWLLFLDADMRPERPDFLNRWLALIRDEAPAAAFGGFTVEAGPVDPAVAVHRALSRRSDCLSAAERRARGGRDVFTSNLLVRRETFDAVPFDAAFTGWGWEDVEWGLRAAERFGLIHVDVPARHLGLEPTARLAAKYEQSVGNFARLARLHPAAVRRFGCWRAARVLARLPALSSLRGLLRRWVLSDRGPVGARAFGLRLYRAALYAETVRAP